MDEAEVGRFGSLSRSFSNGSCTRRELRLGVRAARRSIQSFLGSDPLGCRS